MTEKHEKPQGKTAKKKDKPTQQPPSQKATEQKPQQQKTSEPAKQQTRLLLFNRWDTSGVAIRDEGLKRYMKLDSLAVPRTGGKYGTDTILKIKMSVVERFMNKLMLSGHRGKKHKITSGHHAGKTPMLYNVLKEAFMIIEKKTGQNPLQILVGAIENSALLEEVASYRLGGIIARNAVVTSPQRRLDIALRHLTQGIFRSSFRNKRSLSNVIADELIAAYNNDSKCFAITERNRIEKEAEGAR